MYYYMYYKVEGSDKELYYKLKNEQMYRPVVRY